MSTETDTNPASRYGPVAEMEFERANDAHKPKLTEWLARLHTLTDDDLHDETASAIHGSALVSSFRGNWDHEHCKATAAFNEARRRHRAAGHTDECTGDTIYSQAFAQVWRGQGHSADAYPPRPCDCGNGSEGQQ